MGAMGKMIFAEFAKSFAKTGGTEVAKRVGKLGTEQVSQKSVQMCEVQEGIEIVSKEYDWENIDRNVHNTSAYIKAVVPCAVMTIGGFVAVPVVASAAAFAVLGTGVSVAVYTASNVLVIAGGVYKATDSVLKVKSNLRHNCGDEVKDIFR